MSQKMLIDASHNEETRVVVLESRKVEDFDFESLKKLQLSGNIYLAKVTRVEPSLQAAFLDYGGNRHGFLAFSEIHPDYYQIPVEERAQVDSNDSKKQKSRNINRKKTSSTKNITIHQDTDPVVSSEEITDTEELDNSKSVSKNNSDNNDSSESVDFDELSNEDLNNDEAGGEEPALKKQYRKFRIQEVIKVRQILLIQIVKEERGNKGAALTTFLSLAGRYCVLMPNTPRGGGISRKITNLPDRKKLKEIANSLLVPDGSGLIIRTAGSKRTKLEIKRDYEYLIRQWEQVRDLTLSSIAPTTIYEEGSLIKRAIRDLYSRNIDEILVEGDRGYREAKNYMKMLMPSHAKNVKKYENPIPLFSKYQVEDHLAAMFNPTAQLKSGGYIVINVTEALVAVDVNSGRATKETSIEDTALKTNLEAADELARQIKLRDLAGLIVIDFIDMEDRKNNIAVERRMKDRLKNDRARTQVGRISIFGLLEMSRQRLRPGMIETSTQACSHCHGTGVTRSDDSLSLAILRELEEEGIKNIYSALKLQTPINIANFMLNEKRDRIAKIEERYNLSIKIEAINDLISPEYKIERIKVDTSLSNSNNKVKNEKNRIPQDDADKKSDENNKPAATKEDDTKSDENQNKRRRRRRRKPKQKIAVSITQTDMEISSETTVDGSLPKEKKINTTTDSEKNKENDQVEEKTLNEVPKQANKIKDVEKSPKESAKKIKPSVKKQSDLGSNKKSISLSKSKNKTTSKNKSGPTENLETNSVNTERKVNTPSKKKISNGSEKTTKEEKSVKRKGWWSLPKE